MKREVPFRKCFVPGVYESERGGGAIVFDPRGGKFKKCALKCAISLTNDLK